MTLTFSKWQGTGNDFVLVDDREGGFPDADGGLVSKVCDRHFGVGSDGVVLLRKPAVAGMDFHMEFLNPDGSRSFCGNGSRCAFAAWSAITGAREARFSAIDGEHHGRWVNGEVAVSLPGSRSVSCGTRGPDVDQVDTGSPHEIVWVDDVAAVDVMVEGPRHRYDPRHGQGGSNINWVSAKDGALWMRTYERGVERETLSCGSGVVAAGLSALARGLARSPVPVSAPGGRLRVQATADGQGGYTGLWLIGPVGLVFHGSIDL
jgi:diaminopimelate epimerase